MTTDDDRLAAAGEVLAHLIDSLLGPAPAGPPADRRTTRAARRKAALSAARRSGCTCNPDIKATHAVDGVPNVSIAHDAWCPIKRAPQLVLYRSPTAHPRRSPS